jgi:ABC-type transporter Mla subunit MlaD
MSSEQKYFKLGLFVLGAVAIGVTAVVVLGAGTLLEKKLPVETYVDESIQGLDVGAPVKFRGVRVGELEKIDFVTQAYGVKDGRIRLLIALHPESTPRSVSQGDPREVCERMANEGMRIRLASAGLTGGTYLELDLMEPKEHPPMEISWTPQYPYIPSVPSTGIRLTTHVENILEHVEKMKLDTISEKIVVLLESLDGLVKKVDPALADIGKVATDADGLIKDARRVVNEDLGKDLKSLVTTTRDVMEKEVGPAVRNIRASVDHVPPTFDKIDATLERIGATLRRVDRTLAENGGSMDEALDNLRVVTQDLRDLTGQVKRYPASALFGEAPPKKGGNK